MIEVAPYPLQWPDSIRRSAKRERSRFQTQLSKAMSNVQNSLRLYAEDSGRPIRSMVISSNAVLGDMRPADPGVAVWFEWDGDARCIAVDRYDRVECNLQAIHHVLEARRVELRHAGIEMARATWRGFVPSLPAPGDVTWREVLEMSGAVTAADVQAAWKAKVKTAREKGQEAWVLALNVARDEALQEIGS